MPETSGSRAKRKLKPSGAIPSRKKSKTVHLTANDLPWKTVSKPREADLGDGFDGVLELEEVDDVEVVYEETAGGRVVKFKVRCSQMSQDVTRRMLFRWQETT